MKASDYIVAELARRGVRCVFELSGGMIAHLLDSLALAGSIRVVSMHHEQGAAFAAEGYGRMTGTPGVAMATSGPGAINLLTGVGSCHFDSTPAVFITGQVNRHEQKGARAVRQLGFQETDIVSMAMPIVKAAWKIESAAELPGRLSDAFSVAVSGRPGPVVVDVPMDVQREDVVEEPSNFHGGEAATPPGLGDEYAYALLNALLQAKRPLILVGGGVRSGWATDLLREFVGVVGVPVIHSLMAVDVMPAGDPLRVGMIGSYGNRWANWAAGTADFLLVLGSRLDVRQTGSETGRFSDGKTIYHVDCDAAEMNNRVTGCHTLVSELKPFLSAATSLAKHVSWPSWSEWRAEIRERQQEWPDVREVDTGGDINPNAFMHELSSVSRSASAYVVDVGQHQMWAAQSLDIGSDQRFLTSGGMGAMGFALPAAIGAACGCPGRPVLVIAGDGAFQCNVQELQTVVRNKLPIKMIVVNNRCHGMVRQFQESYFDSRYQSTLWGYSAPDFVAVARAYGLPATRLERPEDTAGTLAQLWADPTSPALLEVMVGQDVNVYPKMAFGRPITEMEPLARPVDMEGT